MNFHSTPFRLLSNWSQRRISISYPMQGHNRKIAVKKILIWILQFHTKSLWSECGTQMYQWYEFTPHENLILQTLHPSVGSETEGLSFLSLIATSGKPFQNEFHLHIMSAARRDDAYQMLFRSDWNVIAKSQRKTHLLHFPVADVAGVDNKQSQDCWKSNI